MIWSESERHGVLPARWGAPVHVKVARCEVIRVKPVNNVRDEARVELRVDVERVNFRGRILAEKLVKNAGCAAANLQQRSDLSTLPRSQRTFTQ